jgi:hypothetical protein
MALRLASQEDPFRSLPNQFYKAWQGFESGFLTDDLEFLTQNTGDPNPYIN